MQLLSNRAINYSLFVFVEGVALGAFGDGGAGFAEVGEVAVFTCGEGVGGWERFFAAVFEVGEEPGGEGDGEEEAEVEKERCCEIDGDHRCSSMV